MHNAFNAAPADELRLALKVPGVVELLPLVLAVLGFWAWVIGLDRAPAALDGFSVEPAAVALTLLTQRCVEHCVLRVVPRRVHSTSTHYMHVASRLSRS